MKTKLTEIGNSTGIRLPNGLLAEIGLQKGDNVYIAPIKGGFTITMHDPKFTEDIELAKNFMKDFKNALHELAK